MTTWAHLREWRDTPLEGAYHEAHYLQTKLELAGNDITSVMRRLSSKGQTADALRDSLYALANKSDVAETALTALMRALNTAAESVEQIALEVEATDARIAANSLIIDDAGNVEIQEWLRKAISSVNDSTDIPAQTSYFGSIQLLYGQAKRAQSLVQATVNRLLQEAQETRDRLKSSLSEVVSICTNNRVSAEASGSSATTFVLRHDVEQWSNYDPAAVRAIWDSLSEEQQRQILSSFPDIIGNLPGIPLAVRKEANDQNLQDFLDKSYSDHPDLDAELQRIHDEAKAESGTAWSRHGMMFLTEEQAKQIRLIEEIRDKRNAAEYLLESGGAVKFDPDSDSVIAVNGDLKTTPDHVISYVPGTSTDFGSFSSSGITLLPEAIVAQLQRLDEKAVVFTIKDGPWSTWSGEGANSSPNEMRERGERVYDLQRLIQLEDYGDQTQTTVISHSAGVTKGSAAEAQGMVVDESISLGGSYLVDDWVENPNTDYAHIQYKNDFINALDPYTRTPHNRPEFANITLEPHINNGVIEGHIRVAQGPETNETGIRAIINEIKN